MDGARVEVTTQFDAVRGDAICSAGSGLGCAEQRFVQPGQQHVAADRWMGGNNQQAVIASRVGAAYGRRSPAAETVGLEPFAANGAGEIAGESRVEAKRHSA